MRDRFAPIFLALVLALAAGLALAGDSFPGFLPFSKGGGGGGGGLTQGAADLRYLKLDASNDPLTGQLSVNAGTAATDASITTPSGKDLWLSAAGGAGSRGLKILATTSSGAGDAVELHGSSASLSGRTSILLSTDVISAADRYPVRITRASGVDVWKVAGNGQVLPGIGNAAAPTYSFDGDVNSGLYSAAADTVAISTNGTQAVAFSPTQLTAASPLAGPNGSAAAPTFTFSAAGSNDGMWWDAVTGILAFVKDGVTGYVTRPGQHTWYEADGSTKAMEMNDTQMWISNEVRATPTATHSLGTDSYRWKDGFFAAGTAAAPSLTLGDADTGLYASATGRISFSVNNSLGCEFWDDGETRLACNDSGSLASPTMHSAADADTGVGWTATGAFLSADSNNVEVTSTALTGPVFTSGTMTVWQPPRTMETAPATKPTCAVGYAGAIIYVDDTNDASPGAHCTCTANSAGTYAWKLLHDNTSSCP